MKNYFLPASILIAAALIAGSIFYVAGKKNQTANPIDNNQNQDSEVFLNLADDDILLGDKNALVTVILYSDPSCSFCGAASGGNKEAMDYMKNNDPTWTSAIPGIIENYVNWGKARLVFRYFPGHGAAEKAMKILYCANEQGKFWQLHDKIFANQNIVENVSEVRKLAKESEVDISKLDSCLSQDWLDKKIAKDVESGRALGVKGTPAFFINGTKLEGAYSFSKFAEIIDSLLKS